MLFKRKLYQKMLAWQAHSKGRSALLIQGARRVGKSTLVRNFAESEYQSYILIDFAQATPEILELFEDLLHLDFFFLRLQAIYKVKLHPRDRGTALPESAPGYQIPGGRRPLRLHRNRLPALHPAEYCRHTYPQ